MDFIDVQFKKFKKGDNWVNGLINNGEYYFEAKLFDVGSQFGIEDGRVSKLRIGNDSDVFVNYDRGWDVCPATDDETEVYENVLEFLKNAPKLFD